MVLLSHPSRKYQQDIFPERVSSVSVSPKQSPWWNSLMPLKGIEHQATLHTLAFVDNNRIQAAKILGVTPKTLYVTLKKM